MEYRPKPVQPLINPERYGVSFSLKQCHNFAVDAPKALNWLLAQGWRRFRLMSYWDEHEKRSGKYDFTALDTQIAHIAKKGGVVSLCLGVKQPRWPEYHWPDWAWKLPKAERDAALLRYIQVVVERYKGNPTIISWQLENEALLRSFGERIDIDRRRLQQEYSLVKQLDPGRPVIMSTSNGWGVPLRQPRPNVIGFSYYSVMYKNGRYRHTVQRPWLHRLRKRLIQLSGTRVMVHELQCEPWGPKSIWEMSRIEQELSMNLAQITNNIRDAQRINAYPIDLWGAEWWYWCRIYSTASVVQTVLEAVMGYAMGTSGDTASQVETL